MIGDVIFGIVEWCKIQIGSIHLNMTKAYDERGREDA